MECNKSIMMKIGENSKIFRDYMRRISEKNGMISTYRPILFQLREHDGLSQIEIAKKTLLKAPTVSLTLQKMENDGLIKRVNDSKDLRSVKVYITDLGNDFLNRNHQLALDFEEKIMSHLSKEEQENLHHLLDLLNDALRKEANQHENDF